MNTRNYIEIAVFVIVAIVLFIIKWITKKKVSNMDGMKGENDGAPDKAGKIVGKFGDKK